MTIRRRVLATDEAGVVRVDVDTDHGFRARHCRSSATPTSVLTRRRRNDGSLRSE